MIKFFGLKKGFTLIELLIVIALLGALAVGLLATVDPFEQLKKGTDTATRNTAAELYNSLIRYYAQRNNFPTSMTALGGFTAYPSDTSVMMQAITDIASAGELKSNFIQLAGTSKLDGILVTMPTSNQIIVCMQPQSKAFRNDQTAIYNSAGSSNTGSPASCPNINTNVCYICFL